MGTITVQIRNSDSESFRFSVGLAKSLGGIFDSSTKTWAIPADNWKKAVRAQREQFTVVTSPARVDKESAGAKHYRDWNNKVEYRGMTGESMYGDYYDSIA